jgi:hypothetical protein
MLLRLASLYILTRSISLSCVMFILHQKYMEGTFYVEVPNLYTANYSKLPYKRAGIVYKYS